MSVRLANLVVLLAFLSLGGVSVYRLLFVQHGYYSEAKILVDHAHVEENMFKETFRSISNQVGQDIDLHMTRPQPQHGISDREIMYTVRAFDHNPLLAQGKANKTPSILSGSARRFLSLHLHHAGRAYDAWMLLVLPCR